jgi:hypothetical protein
MVLIEIKNFVKFHKNLTLIDQFRRCATSSGTNTGNHNHIYTLGGGVEGWKTEGGLEVELDGREMVLFLKELMDHN